jgi:hypothetical protein
MRFEKQIVESVCLTRHATITAHALDKNNSAHIYFEHVWPYVEAAYGQ